MSFPQAKSRLEAAVFDRLGEDAIWEGITGTVRVRRFVADQDMHLGSSVIVETGVSLKVRKCEVPVPAQGQQVQVLDDDGNPLSDGLYLITGEPELDRKAVWRCPARASIA